MPRNPNKKHCQTPGCNNWAMRGYDLCRSHLDPVLGSRGAGAPPGNLNAIKTGEYANPTGYGALKRLAEQIAGDPDSFLDTMTAHIDNLHRRVGYGQALPRSLRSIIALNQTIQDLIPHLTNVLFVEELDYQAQEFPPEERSTFKHNIWTILAPLSPQQRLIALVNSRRNSEEKERHVDPNVGPPTPLTPTSEK
jgi:hypothetical protein